MALIITVAHMFSGMEILFLLYVQYSVSCCALFISVLGLATQSMCTCFCGVEGNVCSNFPPRKSVFLSSLSSSTYTPVFSVRPVFCFAKGEAVLPPSSSTSSPPLCC